MASYRDVNRANSSDDSGSDTNSDSDDDQPWKRRKQSNQTESKRTGQQPGFDKRGSRVAKADRGNGLMGAGPCSAAPSSGAKRQKRNNVWGEVVQRQNEDHVAREMDGFNMELSRSRDVESYDYKICQKNGPKRGNLGAPSITKNESLGRRELKHGVGETSDDSWLASAHQRLGERGSGRRKTAKARLGSRPQSDYSSSMKFISICPSLSKQEIAGKIAFSLQESKRELIMRVVNAVGVDKALELWKLTADTEKNGGMMTLNGSRRRLPGGVFLFLMKTDPQVTKQQVDEIFAEEKKKETDLKHKKDRLRRKMAAQAKSMEEEEEFATDAVEETKDATEVVEESRMDSVVFKVEAAKETKDSIEEGNVSSAESGEIESGDDKDIDEAPVSKIEQME